MATARLRLNDIVMVHRPGSRDQPQGDDLRAPSATHRVGKIPYKSRGLGRGGCSSSSPSNDLLAGGEARYLGGEAWGQHVTDPEDVLPNGSEYQTCRRYMTGDANAAIGGAYDAGAEAVLVNDSHWIMRNL
jgi:D-aminopeptidase